MKKSTPSYRPSAVSAHTHLPKHSNCRLSYGARATTPLPQARPHTCTSSSTASLSAYRVALESAAAQRTDIVSAHVAVPRLPVSSEYAAHGDPLRHSFDSVSSATSSASSPADNYTYNQPTTFGGWPLVPPHPNVDLSPAHIPHRLLPRYGAAWETPQSEWAQAQAHQRANQYANAPALL